VTRLAIKYSFAYVCMCRVHWSRGEKIRPWLEMAKVPEIAQVT